MRKLLFIVGLVLFTSGIARAACDMSQPFEIGGSYDYTRVNTSFFVPTETTGSGGGTTRSNTGLNLNGWNAEVVGNPACWLGIVGDFRGVYGTPGVAGFPVSTHVYSYVFGPRINFRSMAPFTPFVEALFGGAHASFSNPDLGSFSQNAFEGDFGGGVDINLGSHWAIRPKADYVLTHFNNMVQNNASISAAIVFKFGGS
jgi:hypothetical protein